MNITENIKISDLTTFRTGGNARFFCEVFNDEEIKSAIEFSREKNIPFFIFGNGSNLLFSDKDFDGILIKVSLKGIKIESEGVNFSIVSASSGEAFDDLINFSINNNLSGLENLWNIPGTVGASVVQNIGAYGTEAKDFVVSVEGIDINTFEKHLFKNNECCFGYRESVFKKNNNIVITKVYFKLNKNFIPNLKYSGLKEKFDNKKKITAKEVKIMVEKIRKEKLPDWKVLGTAGSFFKNPIVSADKYNEIKDKYPELPVFNIEGDFVKIPLGYVLDKICNLKGHRIGNAGFYDKQALVIVNYGNAKAEEIISLLKLAEEKVFEKIGIKIEREVELIGF
ncbi:MAG: UDP-N-acetylmuramate dehydrogenase [Candidatus Taylorbacteria bacterium]|nr:UDP-N-acetylmuramate dehydrogenase [Candidatus Taylorbacteria bacterium]